MDIRTINEIWKIFIKHWDDYSIAQKLEKQRSGITDKHETEASKEAAKAILNRICEILEIPNKYIPQIWRGDETPFLMYLDIYKEEEAQK